MKIIPVVSLFASAIMVGCGGNNTTLSSPPQRTMFVVNGYLGTDNVVTLDGISYSDVGFNDILGPFSLTSDDTTVTYNGAVESNTVTVVIPPGNSSFILFDSLFTSSGPPDFATRFPVRQVPEPPPSGVRLQAFGPLTPDRLTGYQGPMDFYLVRAGQKPADGVPFATSTTLQEEIPFTQNFPAATGSWVIWTTRPGKPSNTLIKTIPFERKDRTTILFQSSSVSGAIYVAHG